jgi:hypothetical protein
MKSFLFIAFLLFITISCHSPNGSKIEIESPSEQNAVVDQLPILLSDFFLECGLENYGYVVQVGKKIVLLNDGNKNKTKKKFLQTTIDFDGIEIFYLSYLCQLHKDDSDTGWTRASREIKIENNCSINQLYNGSFYKSKIIKAYLEKCKKSSIQSQQVNAISKPFLFEGTFYNNNARKTTIEDLLKYSTVVDSLNILEISKEDPIIEKPFREHENRNLYINGFYLQRYQGLDIYWNFFQDHEASMLLMKIPHYAMTFIVLTKDAPKLLTPFDNGSINLFRSPFATRFLRAISKDSLLKNKIDYSGKSCFKSLHKIENSKYKGLVINELIGQIQLYKNMKKDSAAKKLEALYTVLFMENMAIETIEKQGLAEISGVTNNYDASRHFTLEKERTVHIYGTGESAFIENVHYEAYHMDNVELYFDMNNNKDWVFKSNDYDRMFRYGWSENHITGVYESNKNCVFRQYDIDGSKYTMEIKIPWAVLGYIKPLDGAHFGFDLSVTDNDGKEAAQGKIAWNNKEDIAWTNTFYYGRVRLGVPGKMCDTIAYANYLHEPLIIDGKADKIWLSQKEYFVDHLTMGRRDNHSDLSASFKLLYDKENFYALVSVKDDYKNKPGNLFLQRDYGWIENLGNNSTVFEMNKTNMHRIGNAKINQVTDTSIVLPAGKYILHYKSDEGHSLNGWYSPKVPFTYYGIKLF